MIRGLQFYEKCLDYPIQSFDGGNILAHIKPESKINISELFASYQAEQLCLAGDIDLHNIDIGICADIKRRYSVNLDATNTTLENSNICQLVVKDSTVENGLISGSFINNSTVSNSAMINGMIYNSVVMNSIFNQEIDVNNVKLNRVIADDALIISNPSQPTSLNCISAKSINIFHPDNPLSIGTCDDPIICQGEILIYGQSHNFSLVPEILNSTTIKPYCIIDKHFKPYPVPSELTPYTPTPRIIDSGSKISYPTIIRTLGISTLAIALAILIIRRCKRTNPIQIQEQQPISAETEMVNLETQRALI